MSRSSRRKHREKLAAREPSVSKTTNRQREKRRVIEPVISKTNRWHGIIVLIAGCVIYTQTLTYDFTCDDVPIVRDNERITSLSKVPILFKTNYWGLGDTKGDKGLYRPFTLMTYSLNYSLHGISPSGYHVVNVLLHGLASLILLYFLNALFNTPNAAFIAALLFAVHPVHTEVVAGIVGRAEILSFLGIFLCVICYFRAREIAERTQNRPIVVGWLGASVLFYMMGMYSKETGVIAPAVVLATELVVPCERRWLLKGNSLAIGSFVAYGSVLLLFLWMRSQAILARGLPPGAVGISESERILTALRVCGEYVGLLIFPVHLIADYSTPRGGNSVPLSTSIFDPGVLLALGLIGISSFLVIWSWKRVPMVAWAWLVFAISLFPVSNLPFSIGTMKAERLLYTPSAGFLAVVAALLVRFLSKPKLRIPLWTIVTILSVSYSIRTFVRNPDWRNNYHLARATLKKSPWSVAFHTNLFNYYREQGQNDLARGAIERAFEIAPDDKATLFNLANLELDEKRYSEAEQHYRRALKADPQYKDALNNLGRSLTESGKRSEAILVYKKLRSVAPNHPGSYVNLIDLYLRAQQLDDAKNVAEDAVKRFPHISAVQWNAGAVFERLGRIDEARAAYERSRKAELMRSTTGERQSR